MNVMFDCMYVCICVCIIYVYNACMHEMYVYIYMYVFMHICMYACMYVYGVCCSLVVMFVAIRLQGPRFKPLPGQKFETRFLLHAHLCSASGTTTLGIRVSPKP